MKGTDETMAVKILCVHQGHELYGSDRTFIQSVRAVRQGWPRGRLSVRLPQAGPLSARLAALADGLRFGGFFVLRRSDLARAGWRLPFTFPRDVWRAMREIAAHDVTYINSLVVLDHLVATLLMRHRAIVHVHEIPTGIARTVFLALLRLSGACKVFNSEATRACFPGVRNAVVIPNGVAAGEVDPAARGPQAGRALRVLMLGRFNAGKGQGVLVEALAGLDAVRRRRMAVRIVGSVYGDQHHFRDAIVAGIARAGLEDAVALQPFQDDPWPLYAWADVVVVPSVHPESFGLVAVEAMAAGCAVVASDLGGLAELVEEGVTGRLLPPGQPRALADALCAYQDDETLAARHGQAGRARYLARFTEEAYLLRLREVFARVASRQG